MMKLTGAEWYIRFLDEINNESSLIQSYKENETSESLIDYMLNAAQRAAGLEDKDSSQSATPEEGKS